MATAKSSVSTNSSIIRIVQDPFSLIARAHWCIAYRYCVEALLSSTRGNSCVHSDIRSPYLSSPSTQDVPNGWPQGSPLHNGFSTLEPFCGVSGAWQIAGICIPDRKCNFVGRLYDFL